MQEDAAGELLLTDRPVLPRSEVAGRIRHRILDEFDQRAARGGLKAVVMADLARDLGISTKTLYREYRTKSELVHALVDRALERIDARQRQRIAILESPIARIQGAAKEIHDATDRYSAAFFSELRDSYPESYQHFRSGLAATRKRAAEWLVEVLRDGVDLGFAAAVLEAAVRRAVDPELLAANGYSQEQAIDAAVELWAKGALR